MTFAETLNFTAMQTTMFIFRVITAYNVDCVASVGFCFGGKGFNVIIGLPCGFL